MLENRINNTKVPGKLAGKIGAFVSITTNFANMLLHGGVIVLYSVVINPVVLISYSYRDMHDIKQ